MKKVVIFGAGLAGSTTGCKLAKNGIKVEIIEKDSVVGGMCASIRKDGYIFDLGGHRFYTQSDKTLADIMELIGDGLVSRDRKSRIRLNGKYFDYPPNFNDLVFKIKPQLMLKIFVDYLKINLKKRNSSQDERSLKDWMVNRFGKSVYDLIFCPYSQKFWGENPANISSEWANKRIGLNNLGYVIKKLLSNNPNKVIPKTYTTQFYYPDQGIGHICEKMSELIENNNGTIHLNSEIKQIKLEGNRISYIVFQQNGRRESIDGDFFVSTIPINKLVELISPSEENNLKTPLHDLASLRYRSLRLIFVKVNKNRITDCNWLYFPEAKYIFSRISEPKNWSSAMAPKGKTSLCIEIPCTKGDPIWKLHNNSLLNIVTSHLQELGFLRIDEVRDYFCLSLEYAYPVYSLGYKTELNYILGSISKINNLITIGRQGMFNYLSMDEVLGIGFSAAKLIENIFHNERDDKRNILLQFYREQRGSTPHS